MSLRDIFRSSKSDIDAQDPHRDWRLMEKVVTDAFAEQRRSRRWGIFFKLLTFFYLFLALALFLPRGEDGAAVGGGEAHTAVIKVHGLIADQMDASANNIVSGLRKAFDNEKVRGIVLAINSPGGSPVQAGYVNDEIRRLRSLHPDKKVYAVISDLGASGGYYIAAAADEIYADKASLVGSIGVTASSFGFVDTIDKLGVERRHFTAGEHKAFLDPFSPVKQEEKAFWQSVLDRTHQQFIRVVKEGRGERLKDDARLFSGLIWNGEQALELGLIDGLGSAGYVAREIIGEEKIHDYTVTRTPFDEFVRKLGTSIGTGVAAALGVNQQSPLTLQ